MYNSEQCPNISSNAMGAGLALDQLSDYSSHRSDEVGGHHEHADTGLKEGTSNKAQLVAGMGGI